MLHRNHTETAVTETNDRNVVTIFFFYFPYSLTKVVNNFLPYTHTASLDQLFLMMRHGYVND